jgi:hypothetical protein
LQPPPASGLDFPLFSPVLFSLFEPVEFSMFSPPLTTGASVGPEVLSAACAFRASIAAAMWVMDGRESYRGVRGRAPPSRSRAIPVAFACMISGSRKASRSISLGGSIRLLSTGSLRPEIARARSRSSREELINEILREFFLSSMRSVIVFFSKVKVEIIVFTLHHLQPNYHQTEQWR